MRNIHIFIVLCFLSALFGCSKDAKQDNTKELPVFSNIQPTLNQISDTIHKPVSSTIDDQIPGTHRGDDFMTLSVGGVECGKDVQTIDQAASMLKTQLSSHFGSIIVRTKEHTFSPDGEIVLATVMEKDGWQISVDIPVFKRTSKRVIIFPTLLARRLENSNQAHR